MQVQEAFINLRQELAALYDERESDQIAHWVIENITGHSRSARILHKTEELTRRRNLYLHNTSKNFYNGGRCNMCWAKPGLRV